MNNLVSMPSRPQRPHASKLLTAATVAELKGVTLAMAYDIVHKYGMQLKRNWYITEEQLEAAMKPGRVL